MSCLKSQYDQLGPSWYLDQLVHPSASEEALFAMFKFYMDESGLGKNPAEKVCSVAGFVATNSAWRQLQDDWRILLDEFGIKEFHSKEFWARRPDGHLTGPYRDWEFARANEFIVKIVDLISACRPWLLGSSIKLSDFFSYSNNERRYLTGGIYDENALKFLTSGKPGAAYFVPFQVVALKGVELGKEHREDCHFVFDEQNDFSSLAIRRMAEMKLFPPNRHLLNFWGDTVYSSSLKVLPLQCADLAAFCCKEYYKRKMYSLPLKINSSRAVLTPLQVFVVLLRRLKTRVTLLKLEKPELDKILSRSKLSGV